MNTLEIRRVAGILDDRRSELNKLADERAILNCNGHQNAVTIYISGHGGKNSQLSVGITGFDRNYQSKVIRGREMIMLGVIKVYDAAIADCEAKVAAAEAELRKLLEPR